MTSMPHWARRFDFAAMLRHMAGTRRGWLASSGGISLALALLVARPAAQTPALPRLPLSAYATETRDAVEPMLRAAAARPTDASAAGALGRTLQAWQQWHAAHEAFRRAQTLEPGAFDWFYLDGLVLQRLARHAEAAEDFRRALAVTPDYLPAQVKYAESLLKSGDLTESERVFDALLEDPLAETFARFGLGRIAATQGSHDAAVTHLQRAVALFPEWGEAHYALAMSYQALRRREEATTALALHGRFGNTVPVLDDPVLAGTAAVRDDAAASLERGIRLKQTGDLEGAIAAHEAAVVRNPGYAQAHANLISLYTEVRNWAQVEEHYQAVVSLGFGLAGANLDYGHAQELQGRWPQAEAAYRRAIAINPEHTGAHIRLGRALERQKNLEAAAAEFRLAVASRPTDRVARYDLGRMLMALGRPREAISEFERTLEPRDEMTPQCLLGLAVALALAGQPQEAARRFDDAKGLAIKYEQTDVVRTIDEVRVSVSGARQ
jgi:tetratricopeptide (TPR) repeat protein